MPDHDLLALACQTVFGFAALGCVSTAAHGASFLRNEIAPARHDGNFVGLIRSSEASEIEALVQDAQLMYAGEDGRPRFDVDCLTPPAFEARMVLDGYASGPHLYLVLEGQLQAHPPECDIREVRTDADWQAYIELDLIWWSGMEWTTDPLIVERNYAYERRKLPGVRYWLAYVDGRPRAFLSSWPGDNRVGMVEYLFTHPDYRHRGLATALLAHGVADSRARGAGPLIIGADPTETSKRMFASMGFRPLMVSRTYFPG